MQRHQDERRHLLLDRVEERSRLGGRELTSGQRPREERIRDEQDAGHAEQDGEERGQPQEGRPQQDRGRDAQRAQGGVAVGTAGREGGVESGAAVVTSAMGSPGSSGSVGVPG